MTHTIITLLFAPIIAQAQISTYGLTWDSVPVSPATSVIGYCQINDGTPFQAVTVPTIQNGADVIVNLNPGDKIACYAKTTDGTNFSEQSNLAVAYEPMQISAQLCVAAGVGNWVIPAGHNMVMIWNDQILNLARGWEMIDMWPGDFFNLTPVRPCEAQQMMTIGNASYHYATGREGKRGLAVCVMQ